MKKFQFAAMALLSTGSLTLAQPCTPQFQPGYDYGSLTSSTFNNYTNAGTGIERATVFDDLSGAGPAIFVAGTDLSTPGAPHQYLAKFANGRWTAISGFNGPIHTLAVADLGSGPRLCVGGDFTAIPGGHAAAGVAVWDGTAWSRLGASDLHGTHALVGAQTPAGLILYAGCDTAPYVRQWNGTAWTAVGTGPQSLAGNDSAGIRALVYFDDGSGPKLYAGGAVKWDVALTRFGVGVWDGTSWTSPPNMSQSPSWPEITSLVVHNDPDGPHLYAGGMFSLNGQSSFQSLARLVGGAWQPVMTPTTSPQGCSALLSLDTPSGPALFASLGTDGHQGRQVSMLQNGVWSTVGGVFSGETTVNLRALVRDPASGGPCVIGNITVSTTSKTPRAAVWNGAAWVSLETVGVGITDVGPVVSDPDSDEDAVYVGTRRFVSGTSLPTDLPAKVISYVRLHEPINTRFMASGSDLYSNNGGGWIRMSGLSTARLWVTTDTGVETLIAASSGNIYRRVANTWTLVAPDLSASTNGVTAIETFNDGSGAKMYVGGFLGQLPTSPRLAVLQGGQWQFITVSGSVTSLKSFNLGNGPELVIGTQSHGDGDLGALLAWNGTSLRDISAGLLGPLNVYVLKTIDTGRGPQLWCANNNALYVWDGTAWEAPGATADAPITSLDVHRNADGTRSIFMAGGFVGVGTPVVASSHIAELKFCLQGCTADINHDGDSGTDTDIEAFFACLAGTCCPTCTSADFNGDGDSGTDADIESFFRVLAGGAC